MLASSSVMVHYKLTNILNAIAITVILWIAAAFCNIFTANLQLCHFKFTMPRARPDSKLPDCRVGENRQENRKSGITWLVERFKPPYD